MKPITYFELLQLSSGSFLCEELPDNFNEMTDAELGEFLMDNVWGPLDGLTEAADYLVPELWSLIENSADCIKSFLKAKGIEVLD